MEKYFTIVTFINSKFWLVFCLPHKVKASNTDFLGFNFMCANDENIFKVMGAIFFWIFYSIPHKLWTRFSDAGFFFSSSGYSSVALALLVLQNKKYEHLLRIFDKRSSPMKYKKKHSYRAVSEICITAACLVPWFSTAASMWLLIW